MKDYSNKNTLKLNNKFKEIVRSSHSEKHKLQLKNQNSSEDNNKDFDWDWIFDKEWLRIKK